MKKLLLLDGMNLIFRAFYALPPLTTLDGRHINAVLGFLNMFFKLYDEEKPDYCAVAFDLPVPTFRHKLHAEYKATRDAMPVELRGQIPILKELMRAMQVPIAEFPGYEADDVLGTLAKTAEERGFLVTISSGDKDLFQVASDKICIKIPRTKAGKTVSEVFYAADILEAYGVTPKAYIDVKALMGDTSDNVPGVPGIGEKTAVKLIQQYETIENVLNNTDNISAKKIAENLKVYKEQAVKSKVLVTIDVDVPVQLDDIIGSQPSIFNENAFLLVKELELKSLYGKFKGVEISASKTKQEAVVVSSLDEDAIRECVDKFMPAEIIAYQIISEKTFGGVTLAADGIAPHVISADFGDLDEDRILNQCKPLFEGNGKKISWDAKSDIHFLAKKGIAIKNIDFDAMLAAYVLNKWQNKPPNAADLLDFAETCKADLASNGMKNVYYDIEFPLLSVLYDMEQAGICVDGDELRRFGSILEEMLVTLVGEIYSLTNINFNINSPQQLSEILFDRLGIVPVGKRLKTGAYSTAVDVLEKIEDKHPVISKIMEYRKLAKLKSTYADGILEVLDKKTSRVYTTFKQTVTSTGRLSSTEPNLQNIPIRTELGRNLRKAFVPAPSFVFVGADYNQIELRVLAHMSGDAIFTDAFVTGKDIHRITASEVFGVGFDDVTPEQRSAAKAVNFGIIYGQSAFGLANELGISTKEAERYINGFFRRYPGIKEFMDCTIDEARKTGYAITITGRRRKIDELTSTNFQTRAFGERAAMNMPIQGSAADIIKIAMIRVYNRLKGETLRSRLILQVHDELLIETAENEVDEVKQILQHEMENVMPFNVPLRADVYIGKNWYEAK
ncbi:MAG: DNA polymerase I [Defluviitaleaceae bacterium]|nr:DNA polymerase I [Defluviitaleaceae bacterium]